MNIDMKKYVGVLLVYLSMSVIVCNLDAASGQPLSIDPLPSFKVLTTRTKFVPYPFHAAAARGDVDCVRGYLEVIATFPTVKENKVFLDNRTSRGFTALHYAALKGQTVVVRMLLQAGANINAQAENDITPLHLAAGSGYSDVVIELLRAGARTDLKMKHNNMTAKEWAFAHRNYEIVRLIANYFSL